jgi:hypothetical protein
LPKAKDGEVEAKVSAPDEPKLQKWNYYLNKINVFLPARSGG